MLLSLQLDCCTLDKRFLFLIEDFDNKAYFLCWVYPQAQAKRRILSFDYIYSSKAFVRQGGLLYWNVATCNSWKMRKIGLSKGVGDLIRRTWKHYEKLYIHWPNYINTNEVTIVTTICLYVLYIELKAIYRKYWWITPIYYINIWRSKEATTFAERV